MFKDSIYNMNFDYMSFYIFSASEERGSFPVFIFLAYHRIYWLDEDYTKSVMDTIENSNASGIIIDVLSMVCI